MLDGGPLSVVHLNVLDFDAGQEEFVVLIKVCQDNGPVSSGVQ